MLPLIGAAFAPEAAARLQPGGALGQLQRSFSGERAGPQASKEVVDLSVKRSRRRARPGDTLQAAVVLHIKDGWHVNAHEPSQEYLIGTTLDMAAHPQFGVVDSKYPLAQMLNFGFTEDKLAVYEGKAPIFLSLRAGRDAQPGRYTLEGELTVQACNDQVCLRPSTVDVAIPLSVTDQAGEPALINQDLFSAHGPASEAGGVAAAAGNEVASLFQGRGALLAFLGIFVMGLALNLTPCVYPMLSVTVSLFGGREETHFGRSFGHAGLYVAGIVTMYSALGVVAASTGQLFGAWLQSPWLLAGIGVLLLGLALSMFGFYELQLPGALQSRLGRAQQVAGPTGFYLSGLLVGIFAAPCVGPPVIALLAYVGAQGDPLFGLAAFGVMALGLGLPYLVLGTFSGLLGRLPSSGTWMVWVKKVFGVVLVGAGLFYLGLAVWPDYAYWSVPVTLVAGGLYLGMAGARGGAQFRYLRWGTGALAVAAGLLVGWQLRAPSLEWQPYEKTTLSEARRAGRPVLLDFYADWCIPCKELDRVTFTDEEVIRATDDFARVKVDLTHFSEQKADRLRRRFDVAGVPTLVFLGPDGEEVEASRVVGFLGPQDFLKRVRRAREEWAKTTRSPRKSSQKDA